MEEFPETPARDSKPASDEVSPWALAGLGTQFFASILLFVWVGNWLDRRFDVAPLCLLSGVFLGGGGSFFLSYRQLTKPRGSHSRNNDSTPNS
ncbi:AtpZ/AtpI family protein [Gemmatimonas sp.]